MTEERKEPHTHESVEEQSHIAEPTSSDTEVEHEVHEAAEQEVPPEPRVDTVPEQRPRSWALPISAAALIIAILGTGWAVLRPSGDQQRLAEMQARLDTLSQQRQGILDEASQASDKALSPLSQQLNQMAQGLKDVQARVQQMASVRPPDGRYVEIEYELRLAQQRLALEGDTKGAMVLLGEADQRLNQLDDASFLPVRQAVTEARTALDNVHAPDVDGLYIQLSAEIQSLDQLPLAQSAEPVTVHADNATPYSGGWRDQLSRVFEQFKDLIIIKRHDRGLEALVTPGQESTLRQNLRLLLSQAQSGLLRQSSEIYAQSLKEAHTLIERYFLTDNDTVKATLARLDTLSQQQVRPALPDISNTLEQWHQALTRHQAQGE